MQPNRTEKATQRGHRNQCRQWIFKRIRKTREKEQCKQGTSTYRRKTFFPTYQSHNNTYKTNQQHTWSGYTVIHPQERKLIKRMAYLVGQPCVPTFRMTSKITPLYPHVFPAKASGIWVPNSAPKWTSDRSWNPAYGSKQKTMRPNRQQPHKYISARHESSSAYKAQWGNRTEGTTNLYETWTATHLKRAGTPRHGRKYGKSRNHSKIPTSNEQKEGSNRDTKLNRPDCQKCP